MTSTEEIRAANRICREVYVHPALEEYLLDIIAATRAHKALALGASPRAALALYRASQALAAIRNRHYVIPDDIKSLAPCVLTHRLILGVDARLHSKSVGEVLGEVLNQVAVPVEEVWRKEGK